MSGRGRTGGTGGSGGGGGSGIYRGAYTWFARPLVGLSVGDIIRVTDVGQAPGTFGTWTGARWRRLHAFNLCEFAGSVASPLATLGAGVTSGIFALPSVPTIPADLLDAGNSLRIDALVTHIGTGGTSDFNVHIGTTGTTADSLAVNRNITAATNRSYHGFVEISFSSTVNFVPTAGVPTNDQTTATLVDRTTNVNLGAAMYATAAIANGNAADTWKLIRFRLSAL